MNLYSLRARNRASEAARRHCEVERSSKLIDDPIGHRDVNRVGQNLVQIPTPGVPFTIQDSSTRTKSTLRPAWGFFYVNSGLILRAQEESELAGVMAHEISHVTARHGTKNATRANSCSSPHPSNPFGPGGWAGYGNLQGLNLAIPITLF